MFDYNIYWYNDEQSILILEVTADVWDWSTNYKVMQEFKNIAESVSHNMYSIIFFHNSPPTPRTGVFSHVKQMMSLQPTNEVMTIFVGTNSLFKTILNTANKIYLLKNIFAKFRFVTSLEQAINLIEDHKTRKLS